MERCTSTNYDDRRHGGGAHRSSPPRYRALTHVTPASADADAADDDADDDDHRRRPNGAPPLLLGLYRVMLHTACIPAADVHLVHTHDPCMSDGLPSGRASDAIYGSVLDAQTYDAFRRPAPDNGADHSGRAGGGVAGRHEACRDLLDMRAEAMEGVAEKLRRKKGKGSGNSSGGGKRRRGKDPADGAEEKEEVKRGHRDPPLSSLPMRWTDTKLAVAAHLLSSSSSSPRKKLTTPAWKIRRRPIAYGPPGLVPLMSGGASNSEGNEKFFSYDGEWKDGNMDSKGLYCYEDVSMYKGTFHGNVPNGRGKAIYPGGTICIGKWQNGYPHGHGQVTY